MGDARKAASGAHRDFVCERKSASHVLKRHVRSSSVGTRLAGRVGALLPIRSISHAGTGFVCDCGWARPGRWPEAMSSEAVRVAEARGDGLEAATITAAARPGAARRVEGQLFSKQHLLHREKGRGSFGKTVF